MRFKVQQEELAKALNCMLKLTTKLPKDSPLNCVKVERLNDDFIRLIASNSISSIRYDLEARLIEDDVIIYDINYLTSIVNRLTGELTFDVDVVKDSKSKFKVGHKNQEYPEFIFESDVESIKINAKEFVYGLSKTSYATTKESSGVLSGVLLANDKIVATDGNRLVINNFNNNLDLVLPSFAVEHISKLFENELNIQKDKNTLLLSDDKVVFTTQSLNGVYPKYESILPTQSNYKVQLNKCDLLEALNVMLPVLNQCNNIATFTFLSDTCIVESYNGVYQGDTDFDLITSNIDEEIKITFNCQFILDYCKYIDEEEITIEMNAPLSAVVFKTENTYGLIMPVQRKN